MVLLLIFPVKGKGPAISMHIKEINTWLCSWCYQQRFSLINYRVVFQEEELLQRDRVHLTKTKKSVFAHRIANLVRSLLRGRENKSPERNKEPGNLDKS